MYTGTADELVGNVECVSCNDLVKLIKALKEKCADEVKLLTLAPQSWSIHRVASEFSVSQYMVKSHDSYVLLMEFRQIQ